MGNSSSRLVFCIIESPTDYCGPLKPGRSPLRNGLDAVRYRDIVAVVGAPRDKSGDERASNGDSCLPHSSEDITSLYQNLDFTTHRWVNEELMKDFNVLPLKFGLILDDDGDVRELLRVAYPQLKDSINKLKGKVEYALEVWWDIKEMLKQISRESAELCQFKEILGQKRAGKSLKRREMLARQLERSLLARRDAMALHIKAALSPCTVDCVSNGLSNNEILMNCSYLIEIRREETFRVALSRLREEYKGRLEFRFVGPLPAYSFTDIEFLTVDYRQIDEARRLLGLGASATKEEIKEAFKAMAVLNHPSRDGGSDYWFKKYAEILAAYRLIRDYCDSYRYSFRREEVGRCILIRHLVRWDKREIDLPVVFGNMN